MTLLTPKALSLPFVFQKRRDLPSVKTKHNCVFYSDWDVLLKGNQVAWIWNHDPMHAFFAFLKRRGILSFKPRYRYSHATVWSIFLWSLSSFKCASQLKWMLFDVKSEYKWVIVFLLLSMNTEGGAPGCTRVDGVTYLIYRRFPVGGGQSVIQGKGHIPKLSLPPRKSLLNGSLWAK